MRSDAASVMEYVAGVPPERRGAVQELCNRAQAAAPYVAATMQHGMPFYTLGGRPFIAVASQKNYVSLYVVGLEETLRTRPDLNAALEAFDKGKGCVRIRPAQLAKIPWDSIDALLVATLDRQANGG